MREGGREGKREGDKERGRERRREGRRGGRKGEREGGKERGRECSHHLLHSVSPCFGADMMKQGLALAKRPHIVIATPGRLADHLQNTDTVSFKKIKFLVSSSNKQQWTVANSISAVLAGDG